MVSTHVLSEVMETRMDVDPHPTSEASKAGPSVSTTDNRASSVPISFQRSAQYKVGYVYSSQMMIHACVSEHGHPEQPERISRIFNALKDADCLPRMKRLPIRPVEREEALLVHSNDLWNKVIAIHSMSGQDIVDSEAYYTELSLYVHQSTPYAARLSCGGVIEAALAVARGEVKKSFAIVRPPGHHAEPDEHMGFCFFNNVAVATRVVQQMTSIKKLMILDWDIHHGNGTQRAFYDDPSVLYISLHRYENGSFYPNGPFGSLISCGQGAGLGYSVNIPWPEKGMGDADYIMAFQKIVMPIAMEFSPEMVIISSGFDAADGDDLGECHVTPAGYAHMTHMLSSLANGKLVVALEGGYCLDAIAASACAVAETILGEAPPDLGSMVASEIATETIWQVAMEQSKYWKSIDPKSCEPLEELEPITFSIPEILKAHRQHYLFTKFNMYKVPLMSTNLEEKFGEQVTCTSDIMTNPTLVVFVHEFGNIRVELDSVATCNLNIENSYYLDFSKTLISWVTSQKYALLDVNVYAKPVKILPRRRGANERVDNVMTYLWDNYIQLMEARHVILIGHGPGCAKLMELINERMVNVTRCVQAVVQVVGHHDVPMAPRDAGAFRKWYMEHSMVILPSGHKMFEANAQIAMRHGKVIRADEPKAIKLLISALPRIQDFIVESLKTVLATNGNRSHSPVVS